jgi:mono/diheme cytochrome c family protein
VVVAAVEAGALALLVSRERARSAAGATAVARGRAVAEESGCFGCHGPGGARPIANPGA